MDLLGLPKLYRRFERQGKEQINPLSFYQLARAFVVDRDISYSAILSDVPDSDIKQIVDVFLGITTKEIADAENRRSQLTSEKIRISNQIDAINAFLKDLDVPTLIEIQGERSELDAQIQEINLKEEVIRNRIASQAINSSRTFNDRRQELLENRDILNELSQEAASLTRQIKVKSDLRKVLESESHRLNRHMASKHIISTFTFSQCPRCLQEITNDMKKRETNGDCMLCGRELGHFDTGQDAWEKSLRDTNQLIKEADELISGYKNRLEEIQSSIRQLTEKTVTVANELDNQTANFVSPLIEEMGLNRARRIMIEKRFSQLPIKNNREYMQMICETRSYLMLNET